MLSEGADKTSADLGWNDQKQRTSRKVQKRRFEDFEVDEGDCLETASSDEDYKPSPKITRIKHEPIDSFSSNHSFYLPPLEPLDSGASCSVTLGTVRKPEATLPSSSLGVLHCLAAGIEPSLPPESLDAARARNVSKKSGSSLLHGVTRHSTTGRWEAHLWDGNYIRQKKGNGGRTRGRQVYLGGWASEEAAGTAYDLAALWFWGEDARLNFPRERYALDIPILHELSQDEMVALLKRHSSGFARGQSRYRGVTRHHNANRFEARLGRVSGNRYLYLGCFDDEISAARAYDLAALQHRGIKAVTNFPSAMYGNGMTMPASGTASDAAVARGDDEALIETHASAVDQPQRAQSQASFLPSDDHAEAWAWAQGGLDPLEGLALLPTCSMSPVADGISDAQLLDMVSDLLSWGGPHA